MKRPKECDGCGADIPEGREGWLVYIGLLGMMHGKDLCPECSRKAWDAVKSKRQSDAK